MRYRCVFSLSRLYLLKAITVTFVSQASLFDRLVPIIDNGPVIAESSGVDPGESTGQECSKERSLYVYHSEGPVVDFVFSEHFVSELSLSEGHSGVHGSSGVWSSDENHASQG